MNTTGNIILKIIAVIAGAAALAICNTLEEKSQEEFLKLQNPNESNM